MAYQRIGQLSSEIKSDVSQDTWQLHHFLMNHTTLPNVKLVYPDFNHMFMRLQLTLAAALIAGTAAMAQFPYFSLDAGTDGVNLNVTNAPPFQTLVLTPPPPPPHHHPYFAPAPAPAVCVPYVPGAVIVDAPMPKAYRKAAKAYRKAVRHGVAAPGVSVTLPGGITISSPGAAPAYYYYDDDDYDDYKDYMKHRRKEAKKHAKKMRKAMEKHHKHHHDHDD